MLAYLLLCSCTHKKMDSKALYNEKANELLLHVIKENDCDCLLELPKKSIIATNKEDDPHSDIEKFLIEKLDLKGPASLDSLIATSQSFTLDTEALNKNKIKVVTLQNLMKVKTKDNDSILNQCIKGIICLSRPVFDRHYKKAVLDYNFAFTCIKFSKPAVFEFRDGKWNERRN